MVWTTTDFVRRVRRKLRIPDDDSAKSASEILEIGDEVSRTTVQALLKDTMENWHVRSIDTTLADGQEAYPIPSRLQAGALRDVALVDDTGREHDVTEFLLEHGRSQDNAFLDGRVRGHFIEDNSVIVRPEPSNSVWTLRMRYRRRPARLVPVAEAGLITLISGVDVTVSAVPSAFGAAPTVDAVQALPPFDVLEMDAATTIAGSIVTFPATVSTRLAVGDYVALADETPVPQIPTVCHDLLVYETALVAGAELGKDLAPLILMADRAREGIYNQLQDRQEGSEKKIIRRHSPLRQRYGRIT